jgi:hypothetical protein
VLECNNFENVNALADGKKLRTYKLLKNEFGTVKYVELFMPKKYRSALCKFRCGVATIRIETGRYVLSLPNKNKTISSSEKL